MQSSFACYTPCVHPELHVNHKGKKIILTSSYLVSTSKAGDEKEPPEGQGQLALWSPKVSANTFCNNDFKGSVAEPEPG